ncbi:hypothetical protein AWI43_33270 [Streptomyces sp. WAC04657]|nr:hypothetical protein AWI43_33270 [Streptomyces sp. WAC04657]
MKSHLAADMFSESAVRMRQTGLASKVSSLASGSFHQFTSAAHIEPSDLFSSVLAASMSVS